MGLPDGDRADLSSFRMEEVLPLKTQAIEEAVDQVEATASQEHYIQVAI